MYKRLITILLFTGIALSACHEHTARTTTQKWFTVAQKPITTRLFFSGTIQPIRVTSVTSPTTGIIKERHFEYGQTVKKDQPLFVLDSSDLETNYHDAFTDYLKAKQAYNDALVKFSGTQALWKAEVISHDDYLTERSSLMTANVTYLQSRYKLEKLLKRFPGLEQSVDKLSLDNIDSIQKILTTSYSRLNINAPSSGIALLPAKAASSNTEGSCDRLLVGCQVKEGDEMAAIGDLSGFSIEVKVNEIELNQLKIEQDVTVTGPAFPKLSLQGHIASIDAQAASSDSSGDVALFPVTVVVNKLTPEDQKTIHVGMTAKLQVTLSGKPGIMIPINAVVEKDNQTLVHVMDPNSKTIKDVSVVTGATSADQVVIEHGLKPGDQVQLP